MQEWENLWDSLDISAQSPREMRAWLRQAHDLIDANRLQRTRRQENEQCEKQRFACISEIVSALESAGHELERPDSLIQAILAADAVIADTEEQNRLRDQLQYEDQRLSREFQRAEATVKDATNELSQWANDWQEAIAPLQLRDGAEPAEANAAIEATKHLLEHLEEAASLEQRIAGIDRDATQFQQDVHELCDQVSPSLTGESVQHAVENLVNLLECAHETRTRQEELTKQLDAAQTQRREADSDYQRAEALLTTLCAEAGCQQWNELPAAEENSRRRAALQHDIRDAEDRLIQLANGKDLDEFVESLSEYHSQDIAEELPRLGNEISDLREKESSLGEEIGRQQNQLAQMDGGAQAAEARQRAEQVLAEIRSDAQQYARLHLAGVVLQRAVERYRQRHQGPVLQRASDLFAMLTLGEFEALRADLDDSGAPVLVGVRRSGEVVHVEGMSDGTSDQLYLALRLASLETDLAGREPLPLVVDDILIKFDDDRAVSALKALAATSEKTQVILFTHHEHVIELARSAIDDQTLFTHELNRRPIPAEAT